MNFPSRGFGEIQPAVLKSQKRPAWWEYRSRFLTLASELCEDTKWQRLIKELD